MAKVRPKVTRMFKPKLINKTKIDTLVGASTHIQGDVSFGGGLHLDGTIHGNVKAESGKESTLAVSEHGTIDGNVSVTHILLNGLVKGDIQALGQVELGPKARVLGSVHYLTIETSVGAQINGKLIHRGVAADGEDEPQGAAPAPSET